MRNLHTVFHTDFTSLQSQQEHIRIFFSPPPHQHMVFVDIMIIAILIGVRWYLIVVLICMSLMISDLDHLLICLLVIYMSSLEKCTFLSFVEFLTGLCIFCYWLVLVIDIFYISTLYQIQRQPRCSLIGNWTKKMWDEILYSNKKEQNLVICNNLGGSRQGCPLCGPWATGCSGWLWMQPNTKL